jgi:hypothetical protein
VIVDLTSAVDLGVQHAVSATQVIATDAVDFTIDVSSTRTQPARGGSMTINLGPGAATVESIDGSAHECSVYADAPLIMLCNLAAVPAATTTRIVAHVRRTTLPPWH